VVAALACTKLDWQEHIPIDASLNRLTEIAVLPAVRGEHLCAIGLICKFSQGKEFNVAAAVKYLLKSDRALENLFPI
jgi:hypothetical protein